MFTNVAIGSIESTTYLPEQITQRNQELYHLFFSSLSITDKSLIQLNISLMSGA